MKKKIVIILVPIIIIALCLVLTIPYTQTVKDIDSSWISGYADPKQYYKENDIILKSTTRIIDGISYTFDDIGRVLQEDREGTWGENYTYYVGDTQIKKMWYLIDDKWYYFNSDGHALKEGFYSINGITYYIKNDRTMNQGWANVGFHKYYSLDTGELVKNISFSRDMVTYITDKFGRVHKNQHGVIDYQEKPSFLWKNKLYYKDTPSYYFVKQLHELKEEEVERSNTEKNTQSYQGFGGFKLYTKENSEDLFVLDISENTFYCYKPDIPWE